MVQINNKAKILLIALGALLLIAAVIYLIAANLNFRFFLLCGISCALILYGLFFDKLARKKWLTRSILTLCACFIAMVVLVGAYGTNDNVTYDENAVIVLGAGIKGEYVSQLLAFRLLKAVEYIESNPEAVIVVSGGQGPDESISEALAMERYLIRRGVPAERIIKEEESTSTYENLLFSKEILDNRFKGSYKTVVITNDFHIFRAVGIAGKLGLNTTHFHAKTYWSGIPVNYTRECLALVKFWIFGR